MFWIELRMWRSNSSVLFVYSFCVPFRQCDSWSRLRPSCLTILSVVIIPIGILLVSCYSGIVRLALDTGYHTRLASHDVTWQPCPMPNSCHSTCPLIVSVLSQHVFNLNFSCQRMHSHSMDFAELTVCEASTVKISFILDLRKIAIKK